jgi:hypothetical protein
MGMPFGKLQSTLAVKLFEEGSSSSYSMIISKSFEGPFKGGGVNIKLKVSDDRWDRQTTTCVVSGDMEDNLTFMPF